MRIHLRYFASIREALGPTETLLFDADAPATLGALRDRLLQRSPAHAEVLARTRPVRIALDQVLSDESAVLPADAEVAFFPPVTGG